MSGVVAAPISPIPAACASGAMVRDGIPVITGLVAMVGMAKVASATVIKNNCFFIVMYFFIYLFLLQ
jgi:hypothetical protein